MLKTACIHPEILAALGSAGHLAKVLITDGNYPHNTRIKPNTKIVWANFVPGVVDGVTLLKMVADVVPIEAAEVMQPTREGQYAMTTEPPIWAAFRQVLKERSDFRGALLELQKPEFNVSTRSEDLALVIASAETQIYANIIITIGVVK